MEIRDYIRMLKRGWPAVLLITAVIMALAGAYLAIAPKRFDAGTVIYVSANNPRTIQDMQSGNSLATTAVVTYAQIIDSSTVLGPVAADIRPRRSVDELAAIVTATVRPETTLIDINASGGDPKQMAAIANATAASAIQVIRSIDETTGGRSLVRVQQIRPAIEPPRAGSPNVKRVLAVSLLVGVFLGLALTIAAQTLDTRIRRVQDLGRLSEVPLLGALPHVKRAQRQALALRDEPVGAVAEAYRTLRTNMRFLEAQDRRSLLFTSVADDLDGAGVPANVAWTLAQAGQRVLLVDLDLRQLVVEKIFGLKAGEGLSDVLAGHAELPEVIYKTSNAFLSVLPSGTNQPSPSELLSSPELTLALRQLEQEYAYVILHAPPLLFYSDAAVVSGAARYTFVTVAAGRTQAQELTTALTALSNVRVEPAGLVLTGARRSAFDHGKARAVSSRSMRTSSSAFASDQLGLVRRRRSTSRAPCHRLIVVRITQLVSTQILEARRALQSLV